MPKKQWFGWVVHARQERGDYMALVAIVATFGVGMIAVGSYLAVSGKHLFPHWVINTLVIAGVSIIFLMVLAALVLGALPFFTRPKLRLGTLSRVRYTDDEVERLGAEHGGVILAECVQVEVEELRGVKAREVEVWITAIDPEPLALTVALPMPLARFDLSNFIIVDVSPKSRRYFKVWVEAIFNDAYEWHTSRHGVKRLDGCAITLEVHHESWTPDSRTYRIPEDVEDRTQTISAKRLRGDGPKT